MKETNALRSLLAGSLLLALGCGGPESQGETPGRALWEAVPVAVPIESTPEILARGKLLYGVRCERCHGTEGDGTGPASLYLTTPPRDFTRGLFKFRTVPSGELPADADLYRTVSAGFPAYGMPAFDYLPSEDRWALVHYVKSFSERFEGEGAVAALDLGEPLSRASSSDEALLSRGLETFQRAQCGKCHGDDGRGFGPSAEGLEDSWGHPIRTLDLTSAAIYFKGGARSKDVMRSLSTGLMGTPMPSYLESGFTREDLWSLAYYVSSLSGERERAPER